MTCNTAAEYTAMMINAASLSFGTIICLVLIALSDLRGTMAASCGKTLPDFQECSLLSPSVALHWRDDGDAISIAMEVDGTWDWLGFGLSEAGGMEGADISIIRRNLTDGTSWWIGDYWSEAFQMPALDAGNQDVYLLSAGWTNGMTTGVFKRPLDTCDEDEDMRILRGTTQYFIFAYGKGWGYHGGEHRGNVQLKLLPFRPLVPSQTTPPPVDSSQTNSVTATAPQPSGGGADSHAWEVRMSNVSIPAQDTAYLCRDFEVPNSKTKVHITNWQVVVDNRQVHHMIIYACAARPANARNNSYFCKAMDPSCVTFYAVWAPGADSFETPPEAGIALGGDSGVNWVVLQIHYTNTALTTDLVDNSGFQLNVSTTLRQYDMGFLTLGTLDISIPPGVANYSSTPNLCPRSCTQQMTRPVTMILAGFHMHPLGKSIRTQWFRNGQELPLLGERRAFDFNYQGAVYIDASRNVLMPGDELITTCTWDSRSRTNITRFGETTDDEMCFNFLLYYPRMPSIDMCITAPPALVGPRTVAFCTNISRVAMLNTLVRSQNTPAILGAYASMMKSGELVDASPRIYAPYSQACSPYNFTNSRGGIDSSSGEHVHNDDPSARMPSLPKASLITPPPRAQQSLPTAVPRPLPPLADYIKTPPSPTAVTKPPPLADYVKTPPVSYAKLPPQVKPPMPSPTAKTMPPIDFAKPPSIVQPPMPSPTAKTMPPIDFAKPPSIVQPPMPSPMAKTMPPIDFAKPPSIVQPPMPSPMAKTMPPIDFAKPPSIVQPPMPSPMAKTMPPIDFAKPPSIVQPPMPSPMAKTMPPIDFAKPPSIVQPPPQTAFPKPLSPPTSAVKPAPPPTAAAKPSPPPTAKPLSPSAAVKPPPAKPSPRPLGPKDVVSPPPPKPS